MDTPKNVDVVQANVLIRANWPRLSIYEKWVLAMALSQIRSIEPFDHKRAFVVRATDLAEKTGGVQVAAYERLRRAAKALLKRSVPVMALPNGRKGRPVETDIPILGYCQYLKSEGAISLEFTPRIIPYLAGLSEQFTRLQLNPVMQMRSYSSIRLYELCIATPPDQILEFELDEFRALLGLTGKYPTVEALRRRVVRPAIKEINATSNIRIKFGQGMTGKRITRFQFQIKRLDAPANSDQTDLPLETPPKKPRKPRQKKKQNWPIVVITHRLRGEDGQPVTMDICPPCAAVYDVPPPFEYLGVEGSEHQGACQHTMHPGRIK